MQRRVRVSLASSLCFFFSSRRRHTRLQGDWSSDVCSSDLEKRRYEQAARLLEDALARPDAERRPQAQLVLGMIYLRNADLHEALARTAATAELDYLDKLLKTRTEGRSRYARLHLAEALLVRGNAAEARRQFEQVRADPGIESRYQAIASVGLGSGLWARG